MFKLIVFLAFVVLLSEANNKFWKWWNKEKPPFLLLPRENQEKVSDEELPGQAIPGMPWKVAVWVKVQSIQTVDEANVPELNG